MALISTKHFDLIGIADSQVLVQDSANQRWPRSLSDLVLKYELHPLVHSKGSKKGTGGLISAYKILVLLQSQKHLRLILTR